MLRDFLMSIPLPSPELVIAGALLSIVCALAVARVLAWSDSDVPTPFDSEDRHE